VANHQLPDSYVCINQNPEYTGAFTQFKAPLDTNIPIHNYMPSVGSLRNYRAYGSIISNGTGKTACYYAGTTAPNITKPISTYDYLYLQHSDNC
jgi:hypothetical protein